MVKSVLGVNHQGLTDWLIQRVSAVIMAVYFIGLIAFLMMHPGISYDDWRGLFACSWVKIATILLVLALLFHAWLGMWTIFTDYVKCYVLRLILQVLMFLALVICFLAAFLILWGV